jgi:hypothetical protein
MASVSKIALEKVSWTRPFTAGPIFSPNNLAILDYVYSVYIICVEIVYGYHYYQIMLAVIFLQSSSG